VTVGVTVRVSVLFMVWFHILNPNCTPLHYAKCITPLGTPKLYFRRKLTHPPLSVGPHLFRGAGRDKRRREQLKWSLAFRLYIVSFPCAQLSGPVLIQPGWAECVLLKIITHVIVQ